MKNPKWDIEESVALFDFYFQNGATLKISKEKIELFSQMLNTRAQKLGIPRTDTFRNVSGICMQLGCVHYVVTNGQEGYSNASKLFYDTYRLYVDEREKFDHILAEFNKKY